MIKYGKGSCEIKSNEIIKSIEIKYRGNVYLQHKHIEITHFFENSMYAKNKKSKSLLIHGNNQIHIGFLNGLQDTELFKYSGQFRIISAKVNGKNIPVEVFGVDYWNMINSTWDYAGKPENYRGNYKSGRVPRKKTFKGQKNKTLKQLPKGRY